MTKEIPNPQNTESTRVDPAELEQLDPLRDTSPVLFMGGTLHDNEKNRFALRFIEKNGRKVLAPLEDRLPSAAPWRNRVRSTGSDKIVSAPLALLEAPKEETEAIISLTQEARSDELISHVENETDAITLIAQSADAQVATIAAHKRPDLFSKVVLVFPSGMDKKETTFAYSKQAVNELKNRKKSSKMPVNPENIFEDPKPSSLRELGKLAARRFQGSGGFRALSSTISGYQGGLLHELRQKKDAPVVSMVLGTKDMAMKPERIIKSLRSAEDVDFLLIVNSTHGIKGRKDLMEKIIEITDVMEAHSHARKSDEKREEVFDLGPLEDRLIFIQEGPYSVPKEEQERLREIASHVPVTA